MAALISNVKIDFFNIFRNHSIRDENWVVTMNYDAMWNSLVGLCGLFIIVIHSRLVYMFCVTLLHDIHWKKIIIINNEIEFIY